MSTLSRDQILAQKELRTETVLVPEWGGEVVVRELMASEADMFESQLALLRESSQNGNSRTNNAATFRAKIVSLACVDDSGARLFKDSDVEELGKLSRAALDRVSTVAMRLSGYSAVDTDAKKKDLPPAEDSSIVSH